MDVGVIGVGAMGKNHVRVYSELKSVDSLGIYDVNTAGSKSPWRKAWCNRVRFDQRTAR